MPQAGFDDDSLDFPEVERRHVRERYVPDWDWTVYDAPSPRVPLRVPLAQARVGLVSTAGAHQPGERPLGASGQARAIPVEAAIAFDHPGYDVERAAQDPEVIWPVNTLGRLAAAGVIGEAVPTALSTMGGVLIARRLLERAVPQAVEWAAAERLDLALLVPV